MCYRKPVFSPCSRMKLPLSNVLVILTFRINYAKQWWDSNKFTQNGWIPPLMLNRQTILQQFFRANVKNSTGPDWKFNKFILLSLYKRPEKCFGDNDHQSSSLFSCLTLASNIQPCTIFIFSHWDEHKLSIFPINIPLRQILNFLHCLKGDSDDW